MTPDQQIEMLIRIDANVTNLQKDLLGNGQPGRIQILEEKVDEHNLLIAGSRAVGKLVIGVMTLLAGSEAAAHWFGIGGSGGH